MRLTAMMAMVAMAGINLEAGPAQQRVTVYVKNTANVPSDLKVQAQNLATSMFAGIGVRIDWRNNQPPASAPGGVVAIDLATSTPKTLKPGALAYATPYEGVHICIFWDRMELGLAPAQMLAHVMVHEITHILEGVSRHSETGIMKALWTDEDFTVMKNQPLKFAAEDVDLIHRASAGHTTELASLIPAVERPGR